MLTYKIPQVSIRSQTKLTLNNTQAIKWPLINQNYSQIIGQKLFFISRKTEIGNELEHPQAPSDGKARCKQSHLMLERELEERKSFSGRECLFLVRLIHLFIHKII